MSHYLVPLPAVVGTSGGRTSGYLAWHVWQATRQSTHVVYLFTNTGFEHPATLRFLANMRDVWGLPIRALEYHHPCDGSGPVNGMVVREVRLEDCDVLGKPFRTMLKATYAYRLSNGDNQCSTCEGKGHVAGGMFTVKCSVCGGDGKKKNYSPLPTPAQRVCTGNLKEKVVERWLKEQGFEDWVFIPGLRADEMRRVVKARERGGICPLASSGVTKGMILEWWRSQPFDLEIDDRLGNCSGCFLKSTAKLLWIAHFYPELLEPFAQLEDEYNSVFRLDRPSYRNMLLAGQRMSGERAEALVRPSGQTSLCSVEDSMPCSCTD